MPKTKQSSIVGLYFALITSCQWIYMKTIYSNKLVSWVRVCTHKNGHLFTFFFYFCLSVSRFEFRTMKKSHRNGSLYSTSSLLSFFCSIFVLFFGSDMSCVCVAHCDPVVTKRHKTRRCSASVKFHYHYNWCFRYFFLFCFLRLFSICYIQKLFIVCVFYKTWK